MASKKRKNSETQFNIDLPRELVRDMYRFCDEENVTRKALIELAIRRLLNEHRMEAR